MFTQVPKTDDEVYGALVRSSDFRTEILRALYRVKRAQGMSVLDAYEYALLANVGATRKECRECGKSDFEERMTMTVHCYGDSPSYEFTCKNCKPFRFQTSTLQFEPNTKDSV